MRSRHFIATPPGATIKEQLEDRGMTQKEFATRMDMSEKHVSHLINGEVRLTPEVALRIEYVLGIPAQFWNNLEARYREKCAQVEAENAMDADIELAKKMPYTEAVNYGWLQPAKTWQEKVTQLRKFFGVAKLGIIDNVLIPGIAYRRTEVKDNSVYALALWAQRAKQVACFREIKAINIALLKENISKIRAMTIQKTEDFQEELYDTLAECGIALVLLPHMKGAFLHGATFYDGKKIVMGLTLRCHDADRFWFSLFHEIGHVVLGHIGAGGQIDEEAANDFAKNILIPSDKFDEFTEKGIFTDATIYFFAKQIDIAPGIVVGRLQKEGYVSFAQHNNLKVQYKFVDK